MMNPAYRSVTIFTTGPPAASAKRMVEHPLVATVIPVWQEVDHLERCLASFIAQDWPADRHLIQVVDGGSSDGTRDIVTRLAAESEAAGGPRVVLLDNPDRFVPHARNQSLASLPDEVELVLEMIGHVWVPVNHLSQRVADLLDLESESKKEGQRLAGIGTLVRESDENLGLVGRWVEATLQNPLASGRGQFAQFRGRERTHVPPFTLYRRGALDEVGGWDERFITTQDSELNHRLEQSGWELWRSDVSYCRMAKRTTMGGWLKFGHRYGFWRMKHLRLAPSRASLLEFLPWIGLLTTLFLCCTGLKFTGLGLTDVPIWLIPPLTYAVVLALHGLFESITRQQPTLLLGMPLMLFLLHVTFSVGLLDGLIRKGRAPKDRVN